MLEHKNGLNHKEVLADRILYYKAKYYDGKPEISDSDYDKLEEQLKQLDPENPVLQIVGNGKYGTVKHYFPMLSCNKAKSIEDVVKWSKNNNIKDIVVSYKVDGMSLCLIYNRGKLVQALTRGNGEFGEDVTLNVMKINVPKVVPFKQRVEIRGELYMKLSDVKKAPDEVTSPRNYAVGTLRQRNPLELEKRILSFKAFEMISILPASQLETNFDHMKELSSWGFETALFGTSTYSDSIVLPNQIINHFETIKEERKKLDFEIDGIVFRANNILDYSRLGNTSHYPRGMIALKFENQVEETELLDITWQVGRFGTLTPVAELAEVEIAGAKIKRATLHNMSFLEEMGVNIGDIVELERAGDVIPKVVGISEKKNFDDYIIPENCPSCDAAISKRDLFLYCINPMCRDMVVQNLLHWLKALEIKGAGIKNMEKLYDNKVITRVTNFYDSSTFKGNFVSILGKNGSKLFHAIRNKKEIPLHQFLYGLGFDALGRSMSKKLAKQFETFDDIKKITYDQFLEMDGIAEITADKLFSNIQPSAFDKFLNRHGYTIINENFQEKVITMKGKVYVTGSVPNMKKKEVEEFIKSKGFDWSSSVSKKLTYLVTGDKAGQAKLTKAEKIGVTVISWEEFLKVIK